MSIKSSVFRVSPQMQQLPTPTLPDQKSNRAPRSSLSARFAGSNRSGGYRPGSGSRWVAYPSHQTNFIVEISFQGSVAAAGALVGNMVPVQPATIGSLAGAA